MQEKKKIGETINCNKIFAMQKKKRTYVQTPVYFANANAHQVPQVVRLWRSRSRTQVCLLLHRLQDEM